MASWYFQPTREAQEWQTQERPEYWPQYYQWHTQWYEDQWWSRAEINRWKNQRAKRRLHKQWARAKKKTL
eukprot:6879461-Karenia_brevis.AAC.1